MNVTRLAPSPTGALHLGNARTFLLTWILARKNNWKIILRIEDLDGPRIKKHAAEQAIEDLRWLGIDWDEGPIYQSQRLNFYKPAIEKLLREKEAYYCTCTRKEVELAASAPHTSDNITRYPGTCRDNYLAAGLAPREPSDANRVAAVRFDTRNTGMISFQDQFAGPQSFDLEQQLGDFVIAKSDGTPAYQLSVVLDDADENITQVIRGNDLLDSTPRQIALYRALNLEEKLPQYTHLPLIIGEDGRRLAKRHGDTRLSTYRDADVKRERLLALLAKWSGINCGDGISLEEFTAAFDLAKLPKEAVVFAAADDHWLRNR